MKDKKCRQCIYDCKQSEYVALINCPKFQSVLTVEPLPFDDGEVALKSKPSKERRTYSKKGSFNYKLSNEIFIRDGGMCVYCGKPAQDIDHVIPASDGGRAIRSNGVCACKSCNTRKGKHPEDVTYLATAITWLSRNGEDVSWMDGFYDKRGTDIPAPRSRIAR